MVMAMISMAASAQWYAGGSLGVMSVKPIGGGDSETVYKVVPEVGYNLNDEWAVGVKLGYQKGLCSFESSYGQNVDTEVFQVSPYARYSFFDSDPIKLFVDGCIGFASYKDLGTEFQLGLRPGIAFTPVDNLSLVAHVGFVGFTNFSPKGDGKSGTMAGVDFDNANILFGIYYNF